MKVNATGWPWHICFWLWSRDHFPLAKQADWTLSHPTRDKVWKRHEKRHLFHFPLVSNIFAPFDHSLSLLGPAKLLSIYQMETLSTFKGGREDDTSLFPKCCLLVARDKFHTLKLEAVEIQWQIVVSTMHLTLWHPDRTY